MADSDPDSFLCPIQRTLMADPVVAADGHTYERSAILEWFKEHSTSPLTGVEVESKLVIPNHALRKTIDEYCRDRPDRIASRTESAKPTGAATSAGITPAMSYPSLSKSSSTAADRNGASFAEFEERPPWEFDKSVLANRASHAKRPVIVCTSRTSLYSGEGVIVGFEPTPDGKDFKLAFTQSLKLESKYSGDASISSIQPMSDSTFAASTRNGSVSTWKLERNTATGAVSVKRLWVATSELHSDETTCVAYMTPYSLLPPSNDESSFPTIASGSRDRTVKLWKPLTSAVWKNYATLDHRADVRCVVGTSEGHVASGGSDWSIKIWDPNCPEEPVQVLDGHSRSVRCLTTEAGSERMASGSDDEQIVIWDCRQQDAVIHKIDTGSPVLTICWGDGFICAGGGVAGDSMTGSSGENMGGWLRFWEPRMWKMLCDASMPMNAPKQKLEQRPKPRSAHDIATNTLGSFTLAGNKAIVSGGDDKKLRIWLSNPLSDVPFTPKPTLAYELGGATAVPIAVDTLGTFFL